MENPNISETKKELIKKSLAKIQREIAMIAYWRKDETNKDESDFLESFGYSCEFEDFISIEIKVTYIKKSNVV